VEAEKRKNFVVCLFFGIMENAIYFKFEFAKTFFIIVVYENCAKQKFFSSPFYNSFIALQSTCREPIFAKGNSSLYCTLKVEDCFMIILRIVYRLFYIGNFNEKVWAKSFEENVFI
jgi:hypothetical protein